MQRYLIVLLGAAMSVGAAIAQDAALGQGAPTPQPQSPAVQSAPAAQPGGTAPASPATQVSQPAAAPASAASASSGPVMKFAPGTVVPAELTKTVDAKKAKVGDAVQAKLIVDLTANGQVALPAGAKVLGHVTVAQPRDKSQSESKLGILFDKVVAKGGQEMPLNASIQAVSAPVSNFNAAGGPMAESGGMPEGSGNAGPGMTGSTGRAPGGAADMGGNAGNTPSPGNPGRDTGGNANPGLSPETQGVTGMEGVTLGAPSGNEGAVLTSQKKNVKLEDGTRLMLRVNGQ